jgi:gluconolactonase
MTKIYCISLLIIFSVTLVVAQSPVPPGATLELLESGFLQPEGPVWIDGLGILFSDIKADRIYQWSPVDSALTTYLYPSDSSNGLTLDLQGHLILTQMAERRVSRRETNGTITPLASTYNGKKFNSPNDLVVKSDGSIFFTDPDFNIPGGLQNKELTFQGVFRISPYGVVYALDSTTFDKPNGICFSPDETKLYVDESMPTPRTIYRWDVVDDSTISNKQAFYKIPTNGYLDGMKVDPDGNLYCTGPTGIWIVSPAGICLDTILTPENPTNCNWGDTDRKTLYITGQHNLYRIRLASGTNAKDQGYLPSKSFELYANYPNPFNPSTTISYQIPALSHASLKIYDLMGRHVATLVDEVKKAGSYSLEYNAVNLASGIYFYQLKTGSFSQTKKMILSK